LEQAKELGGFSAVAEEASVTYGEGDTDVADLVAELEKQMAKAAAALEFENAARLRDEINRLKEEKQAS
jgi:excinuclease ABC subunit B